MSLIHSILKFILDKTTLKWMTIIGTIASILGLIISGFVYLSVKKIRRFYLLNARVPELLENLSEHASKLSDCLNSYSGRTNKIEMIIVDIEVSLNALRKKVQKNIKGQIDELMSLIKRIWENNDLDEQKKKLEKIHVNIYRIRKELQSLLEDSRWEI